MMDFKTWYKSISIWLCEYWDCLWSVKRNKPKGKPNAGWVDNKEWEDES